MKTYLSTQGDGKGAVEVANRKLAHYWTLQEDGAGPAYYAQRIKEEGLRAQGYLVMEKSQ